MSPYIFLKEARILPVYRKYKIKKNVRQQRAFLSLFIYQFNTQNLVFVYLSMCKLKFSCYLQPPVFYLHYLSVSPKCNSLIYIFKFKILTYFNFFLTSKHASSATSLNILVSGNIFFLSVISCQILS